MSHASTAVPRGRAGASHPSTTTEWATWILIVAVIVVLAVSFVLWQQVSRLETGLDLSRARLEQMADEAHIRQCLILTEMHVSPKQLLAVKCEVQ